MNTMDPSHQICQKENPSLLLSSLHIAHSPMNQTQKGKEKEKKTPHPFSILPPFISEMGTSCSCGLQLQLLLPIIYLLLLSFHPSNIIATTLSQTGGGGADWKSATATYSKQPPTDTSLVIQGACGYGADLHKATGGGASYGEYSAGLSSMLFNRGSTCGACFELRCVDHILWCLQGSPSVILTATDFCPPNYSLPPEYGGWCNFPRSHFELSEPAFAEIAQKKADIIPVQYRRVKCERKGAMRFTLNGSLYFHQVLISNVGLDGEVVAVKVKGSKTGWIPMGRNWGQNWQCNIILSGQPLSFEVTTSSGTTVTSYNVAPSTWEFGQTFEGKQF